ncbi:antibiotic biosynthesis monooxygenase family protein [Pyxidicoccus trucidator]|uniref:antibiotic biosynthesis monooxygenase family protein n=1 Tax=Pyxidicoccus trucidator TaxID=2709662 RepID=UPI0013DBB2C0|nr:antibiotic biosynthesis monooxygenase [Pyxidicoccus trucidator]
MKRILLSYLTLLVLPACGGGELPPPAIVQEDPLADCARERLEEDLQMLPLAGAAVRADGTLEPGSYIVSSTYLKLRPEPEALARFQALMGPISESLQAQQGLVALQVASSERCGTARTLSVWRDEAAMYSFVSGSAHQAAVSSVREVSRGGSIVTHWTDNERGVSWTKAARQLGADPGPFY